MGATFAVYLCDRFLSWPRAKRDDAIGTYVLGGLLLALCLPTILVILVKNAKSFH